MARKGEDCRASVERSIFVCLMPCLLIFQRKNVFWFVQRNIVSGPHADLSTGDKNMVVVVVMSELFLG